MVETVTKTPKDQQSKIREAQRKTRSPLQKQDNSRRQQLSRSTPKSTPKTPKPQT